MQGQPIPLGPRPIGPNLSALNELLLGQQYAAGGSDESRALAQKAMEVRDQFRRWYDARSGFRSERRDMRNLARGYHWERFMKDETGASLREKDYLRKKGRLPLVMNLMASMMANVQGQLLQNTSEREVFAVDHDDQEAVEMLNLKRRSDRRRNSSDLLESDAFVEHAMSGSSAFYSSIERDRQTGRPRVVDRLVHQNRLAYNLDIQDRRMTGLRLVGELLDLPFDAVVRRFAKDPEHAKRIGQLYARSGFGGPSGGVSSSASIAPNYSFATADSLDFYSPIDPRLCRVLCIWQEEYEWRTMATDYLAAPYSGLPPDQVARLAVIPDGYGPLTMKPEHIMVLNEQRKAMGLPLVEVHRPEYVPVWRYYYLAPNGAILDYGDSWLPDLGCPYTVGLNNLIDGETWGMIANVADPQRWMNRLLVNIDHQMTTGARGATYYDKSVLANSNVTTQQMDEARSRGYSVALEKGPARPWQEIVFTDYNRELAAGYFEMVPVLKQFVREISGVTDAALGLEAPSGTPAALRERQVIQAGTNVYTVLSSYFETLARKDQIEVGLLQMAVRYGAQYGPETLRSPDGTMVTVEPERVGGLRVEVAMGRAENTATLRQSREVDLRQDVEAGLLPYKLYLKRSSRPDSQAILDDLAQFEQEELQRQLILASLMAGEAPASGAPADQAQAA